MSSTARRVAEECGGRALFVRSNGRELLLEDLRSGSSRVDITDSLRLGLNLLALDRADLRLRPKSASITDAEIEATLAQRKEARAAKDFATSDRLRDLLADRGVEVMDGDPLGWDWKLG